MVDSVRDWHAEWFYVGNIDPPLVPHSDARPVPNDRWEATPLTQEEKNKIAPFLEQIQELRQQGLTAVEIEASYLRRWVRPLKARVHYGFEYVGAEDPSRMVPTDELTDDEILARLKKILKNVAIILPRVEEYQASRPPSAVSFFSPVPGCFLFFWLCCLPLFFACLSLQDLGRAFDDLPPLAPSNNLAAPGVGGAQAAPIDAGTSSGARGKSLASFFVLGFSFVDPGSLYVEYRPQSLPQGHRSSTKRNASEVSAAGGLTPKRACSSSPSP